MLEQGGDRMAGSDTRNQLLRFLTEYVKEHGYGPTVRELCQGLALRSTATVHYHLRQLQKEGRIWMDPGKKRAISLVEERQDPDPAHAVPVVGTVAAGEPILADEHIEGYLPWEGGEGWFALRVKGESMKNAGILPGDRVIVRPQPTAEPGEIVVALLGDEATVKRFSRRDGGVWLLPENEAFSPIDGREAKILGVGRGVVRVY